ncbi:MAG: hypothetical protein DSY66_01985 [Persephonella sp.]|nr:MAG: hypothetical protein DSY66_01985 [Persephonella sp.]
MDEVIKTADGTETLFNKEFKEAYHSIKAGAYVESLHKFINPCRIKELAVKNDYIKILDVGFGLGYNVAVAIKEAVKVNPNVKLAIVSIEKDKNIFEKIKKINISEDLKSIYELMFKGKFYKEKIGNETFDIYKVSSENFDLKIIFGEGRKIIKNLPDNLQFDAVFYDPFSPKVNTEMWTLDLFKEVKRLISKEGILATYSASLAVRKGLLEAGFKIGLVEPVGRKSYSTVASLKGDIPPLTEKEKNRLENSPYAVPYRDNKDLSLSREEIKQSWEDRVKERIKFKV